jgi:hypothetical protein
MDFSYDLLKEIIDPYYQYLAVVIRTERHSIITDPGYVMIDVGHSFYANTIQHRDV